VAIVQLPVFCIADVLFSRIVIVKYVFAEIRQNGHVAREIRVLVVDDGIIIENFFSLYFILFQIGCKLPVRCIGKTDVIDRSCERPVNLYEEEECKAYNKNLFKWKFAFTSIIK
jgi:hypothetical protein